ncbi:hypothetical protein J8C06_13985 [Chloracidobacterium validum]|uniref:DUF8201 domain-containing protein n=1 Tax=Chloracidobacterium validum TaxID=2821543 RepID=A0ABX8BB40_9BACT|nr:hypothetical protein [Chloracidobacterium validum]QUW04148.1 hypothetical protein J8C06_13985 [Chloracidobacterium validum]
MRNWLIIRASLFTYVAALNLHPLFNHGRSIANSFLVLLTVITLLELLLPLLKQLDTVSALPPIQWAMPLFCLPTVAYWGISSQDVSSPSPDLTSSLLQVVIFVMFVRFLSRFIQDRTVSSSEPLMLSLLTATAVTLKLSNVAFCGTVMVFVVLGMLLNAAPRPVSQIAQLLFPGAVVLLLFCLRGVLLSGAPLYPATLGYINTPWSVPLGEVTNVKNWIYSWARQPGAHWEQVLGSWKWFGPWLHEVTRRLTDVVFPLALFLACGVLALLRSYPTRFQLSKPCLSNGIILAPLLAALFFWFFTAPDPRFANGTFALLAVSSIVLLLTRIQSSVSPGNMVTAICLLFMIGNLHLLHWAFSSYRNAKQISISLSGWHTAKQVPLNAKVTTSGLRVYVPVSGDQCWDAPLPCTPHFNKELRLIDPDDMASGFTVRPLASNAEDAEPKNLLSDFLQAFLSVRRSLTRPGKE